MRARALAFACGLGVLAWSAACAAETQVASHADGKAMIERAITALKANEVAALKAFNDEKNKEFRDRDLYVYCFSLPDGNFTAYQSPVMIGTNVKELKIPRTFPLGNALTMPLPMPPGRNPSLQFQARHQGARPQRNARSPCW